MDISQIFVVGLHIIILSFQQTYGSISSFLPSGTVKVGEQFQISCKINSFPTGDDATLNRNGSLLNTCFQDGGCTRGATQTIDGALFSFTGDSEGIHLTINHLPPSEVGLLYVCVKDGSVEYTVVISTPSSSNEFSDGQLAGIGIGVLFLVGAVAFIIYLIIQNLKGKPAPITNSVPDEPKPEPGNVPVESEPKPGNDKLPSITRHVPIELESMLGNDEPSSIKRHDKLPSIKRHGEPEPSA